MDRVASGFPKYTKAETWIILGISVAFGTAGGVLSTVLSGAQAQVVPSAFCQSLNAGTDAIRAGKPAPVITSLDHVPGTSEDSTRMPGPSAEYRLDNLMTRATRNPDDAVAVLVEAVKNCTPGNISYRDIAGIELVNRPDGTGIFSIDRQANNVRLRIDTCRPSECENVAADLQDVIQHYRGQGCGVGDDACMRRKALGL